MMLVSISILSFSLLLTTTCCLGNAGAQAEAPSFDCTNVQGSSCEAMICNDAELARLDRELARVYSSAREKATNERPPVLKAEQRGWIKGRNECWKSQDRRQCVEDNYRTRIAELQARYHLVKENGPFFFLCDGNQASEVIVTYFQTEPPTLIAERGNQVSLMYLQPSGSGSRYQGRNESLWEHQGEALIV